MNRGKMKVMMTGSLLLICFVSAWGSTAAYLADYDAATNEFTVGSQISEISEDWDPPDKIERNIEYTKTVAVKNTGTADCYVRVFAELMDHEISKAISRDMNTDDWTPKQPDGYYYYKNVLEPGECTEPLFTSITSASALTELNMIVYEESVQAYGAESPQKAFEF